MVVAGVFLCFFVCFNNLFLEVNAWVDIFNSFLLVLLSVGRKGREREREREERIVVVVACVFSSVRGGNSL